MLTTNYHFHTFIILIFSLFLLTCKSNNEQQNYNDIADSIISIANGIKADEYWEMYDAVGDTLFFKTSCETCTFDIIPSIEYNIKIAASADEMTWMLKEPKALGFVTYIHLKVISNKDSLLLFDGPVINLKTNQFKILTKNDSLFVLKKERYKPMD